MHTKKFYTREHVTPTAYGKLLVPHIFAKYDRVMCLDADTLAMADVAKLYHTNMEGKWIAAASDFDVMARLALPRRTRGMKIAMPQLGLDDMAYQYFDAGVLIMDIPRLLKYGEASKWLTTAQKTTYEYMEQDVLNLHCKGHVHFVDSAWNVQPCSGVREKNMNLPAPFYKKWLLSDRVAPKLIHYTAADKPWKNPSMDMAQHWWNYARRLPIYEDILFTLIQTEATLQFQKIVKTNEEKGEQMS